MQMFSALLRPAAFHVPDPYWWIHISLLLCLQTPCLLLFLWPSRWCKWWHDQSEAALPNTAPVNASCFRRWSGSVWVLPRPGQAHRLLLQLFLIVTETKIQSTRTAMSGRCSANEDVEVKFVKTSPPPLGGGSWVSGDSFNMEAGDQLMSCRRCDTLNWMPLSWRQQHHLYVPY